jgi:hypothetical protein
MSDRMAASTGRELVGRARGGGTAGAASATGAGFTGGCGRTAFSGAFSGAFAAWLGAFAGALAGAWDVTGAAVLVWVLVWVVVRVWLLCVEGADEAAWAGAVLPLPKYDAHSGPTLPGSLSYCSFISSTSHSLAPRSDDGATEDWLPDCPFGDCATLLSPLPDLFARVMDNSSTRLVAHAVKCRAGPPS